MFTLADVNVDLRFSRLEGNPKRVLSDYDVRERVNEEIFDTFIDYFQEKLVIAILSGHNLVRPWIIVIPNEVEITYILAILSSFRPLLLQTRL